ncbi:MDR family MFS transporter [Nocardia sp. NPDC006630]|uniref:MDR family MFS transporter n=1 Tax=Nocardia sp. NPDC006630 TaxID=3157181 RepID=UPI0033A7D76F
MAIRTEPGPWATLGALCVGFFMILVDMTIVAVANPTIMNELHTGLSTVVWVTSSYLLAYAVPLLVTGRLGDQFGPKNVYLIGLTIFTFASLACGLSTSITMLILARGVQGIGAALMTPQTMAVITRIFPPDKRGAAMGAWGSIAGVASLVGPIIGGVLVDGLGWKWIFLVNVPLGVIAFVLAVIFMPSLQTHRHRFDLLSVALSMAGMFLVVFGIQQGNTEHWSGRIWLCIAAGLALLAGFVVYQSRNSLEPLVPLSLFRDRNFALSTLAMTAMGVATTGMMLPGYFYLENVRGYSPTGAATVWVLMAFLTALFSPIVGRLVDRVHPRAVPVAGFAGFAVGIAWFGFAMKPDTPLWQLLLPLACMGLANACIWSPLAAIATYGLPPQQAGVGAGVYNTARQVGLVLGSAGIGALIPARLAAHGIPSVEAGASGPLLGPVQHAFSTALAQSMVLPSAILVIGIVSCLLLGARPQAPVEVVPIGENSDAAGIH